MPFSVYLEDTNTFGLVETGNYVDANLEIALSGTNRYALLEQFNNPSTGVNAAPGTVDFSPVGAAILIGMGVRPPTGGTSFGSGRISGNELFEGLHGGFGSFEAQNVRGQEARGLTEFGSGEETSGALEQSAFTKLGEQHVYEYCFAAGTLILMADGSHKPIEQIRPGDLVLSAPEYSPGATAGLSSSASRHLLACRFEGKFFHPLWPPCRNSPWKCGVDFSRTMAHICRGASRG